MKEAIVLYPSPAIGHLISMVELGKLLLIHRPSLSIHILITNQAYDAGPTTAYIASVSTTVPSIAFHYFPATTLPPDFSTTSPNRETLALELLRLNNPNVYCALTSITKNHIVHGLIIDFFCVAAVAVVRELNIPCYYFFTSGAGFLSFYLYVPILHDKFAKSFKDFDAPIDVPGTPPIPPSDVAKPLQDRYDEAYKGFLDSSLKMQTSAGIIVNTFEKLEPRAIRAIMDGKCVPGGSTPPLYCIGPLISSREGNDGGFPECLTWLDSQPRGSVVFLCFGSLGVFSVEQLKEIATGLERSGQRFLWVVRNPTEDKKQKAATFAMPDPHLGSLLPEGFLERTKERGLVVKKWAPQVAVLSHPSVGGFVTHCGWNSVLEAVSAGMPMLAWPLYAEQRHNRVLLVKEMRIALPVDESEGGLVSSEEVEKRVSELMEGEEGKMVRERALNMKEEAKAALSPGGSSQSALAGLIDSWKRE
ncbi:UDP-glycosyltransferase 88B1-like [Syzygium oleosum]|uniref:UDP-glycosyltransferase 88B1-like n=1 Tax=Syzygium oleosum TaxID=219896 RepID=UPI0011D2406E|nr:UDP-glycosyltransferase 88B1-like [Syzygium oleosum]